MAPQGEGRRDGTRRGARPGDRAESVGQDRGVVLGLLLEDAELRVRVPLEGAVAIEMIGLEVEQDRDARTQRLDILELERGELAHDPRVGRDGTHQGRERPPDIPGDLDRTAIRSEHLSEELRRRRLPVGSGDAENRVFEEACAPSSTSLQTGSRLERARATSNVSPGTPGLLTIRSTPFSNVSSSGPR